jgi:hypothetical protein
MQILHRGASVLGVDVTVGQFSGVIHKADEYSFSNQKCIEMLNREVKDDGFMVDFGFLLNGRSFIYLLVLYSSIPQCSKRF